MNGIQGIGGMQGIAQMLMQGGASSAPAMPKGEPPAQVASISNDQGQNLMDIKDELKSAVSEALQNADGTGDLRSTVQDALDSTLEANGFDPAEVKAAMQESGFNPMMAMAQRGGGGFGGAGGGGQHPLFGSLPGGSGESSSIDLNSLLEGSSASSDLVDSFLSQLRSGANLDLEI